MMTNQTHRNNLGEEITEEGGWEEYYDYIFPEDKNEGQNLSKILSLASKWKKENHNI